MWKNSATKIVSTLLQTESILQQQLRTTFVVERKWPPSLTKSNGKPKPLRGRHYVYELVKDTTVEKQSNIDVVLVSYVDGIGNVGDRVSVKPTVAYNSLLLPGLAVYATPDNVNKYANKGQTEEVEAHSSPFAQRTVNVLSRLTLAVVMNKDVPWTLESWHVKASFRKSGYHVAEDAITLPSKPIQGPDMSLQDKEFFVTVTVNKMESVKVRCRIHHWSTKITERLPYVFEYWKQRTEPVFAEDAPVLAALPTKHELQ
ncbi:mitochondrial ribosomal protein L9 [Carabus blaptoides fortunei]